VGNCHKLGECQPPKEHIVCHLEVGYLKLHVLRAEVFLNPDGHRKSDLADRGHHCSRDYSMEWSIT
jgi:hypothetical protein